MSTEGVRNAMRKFAQAQKKYKQAIQNIGLKDLKR